MVTKRKSPEGDWAKVIKAQDQISNQIIKEEQEIQKQSKIRYKEELDKQMQLKNSMLKYNQQNKSEEFSFHVAQQMAMKEFESKKKLLDRSHFLIVQNGNKEDTENKVKIESYQTERERTVEQERIRRVQQELENERIKEISFKNKRIAEEQEAIRRAEQGKALKVRLENWERLKDKKMIEDKMSEMKNVEGQYRELYEKRTQEQEKRLQNYQPVLESGLNKQELIRRRNEEWEKTMQEKVRIQSQIDEENRIRNLNTLKTSLETQIEQKYQQKAQEIQEDKFYMKIAKSKAQEDERIRLNQREKRTKDQEDLKKVYEEQLKERDLQLMQGMSMNYNEKKMHNELLSNLNQNKLVAFPGVPGSHLAESPIKRVYKKIYGNPTDRSVDSIERTKFSSTPQPFADKSYEYIGRKNYNFPDLFKHDPITNPIGAEVPRVLPGQRVTRAPQSHSKLALAGNTLFK